MKNGGFRKGQNPIGKAFKGLGEGIVKGLDAIAEANEAERLRAIERGKIELEHRGLVEDALREYEKHVGRRYQLDERFTTARVAEPITGYNTGLPWDPEHKGHLVTCRDNCVTDHCLVCGMENYGRVYCSKHLP